MKPLDKRPMQFACRSCGLTLREFKTAEDVWQGFKQLGNAGYGVSAPMSVFSADGKCSFKLVTTREPIRQPSLGIGFIYDCRHS